VIKIAATELAQFTGVTLKDSDDSALTAPTVIGRVTNITVNSSYDIQTIDDFDQAVGEIAEQLTGSRTVNVSFGLNMVPSDAGFKEIHLKHQNNTRTFLNLVAEDGQATITRRTLTVGGKYNQFNESYQKPAATVDIQFAADEIIANTVA
jgi:hypothetical protein